MGSVIIVQARMQSTRLPGKVMLNLGGITVLEHVIQRLQLVEEADNVCLAIPDGEQNEPLVHEAKKIGVMVVRGQEEDVLGRYYRAAKFCKADTIMRVTSDCPLIDYEICNRLFKTHHSTNPDYSCNNMPRTWPHGLDCEITSFHWLERAAMEATNKYDREHVTQYIRNHPSARVVNMSGPGGKVAKHRWTLDTAEDQRFFEALWPHLPRPATAARFREILNVIEKNPNLMRLSLTSADSCH